MRRPSALKSATQLFDAVYAVPLAHSEEEKNRVVEQSLQCIADGAWMDARLEFVFIPVPDKSPVEITLTSEEYMLLSWDLPQLARLMDNLKDPVAPSLPHLLRHLNTLNNVFSSRGKRYTPTPEPLYANVFQQTQQWVSRWGSRSFNTPLTPWQVLCGRDLTHTENTALEISTLQQAWPSMNETHLEVCHQMCLLEQQRKTVLDFYGNQTIERVAQSAVGTLVMLMGFTPQSQQHPGYLKILNTLPPDSKAVLEKWRLTQSLHNTGSCSPSVAQKRKM